MRLISVPAAPWSWLCTRCLPWVRITGDSEHHLLDLVGTMIIHLWVQSNDATKEQATWDLSSDHSLAGNLEAVWSLARWMLDLVRQT